MSGIDSYRGEARGAIERVERIKADNMRRAEAEAERLSRIIEQSIDASSQRGRYRVRWIWNNTEQFHNMELRIYVERNVSKQPPQRVANVALAVARGTENAPVFFEFSDGFDLTAIERGIAADADRWESERSSSGCAMGLFMFLLPSVAITEVIFR